MLACLVWSRALRCFHGVKLSPFRTMLVATEVIQADNWSKSHSYYVAVSTRSGLGRWGGGVGNGSLWPGLPVSVWSSVLLLHRLL